MASVAVVALVVSLSLVLVVVAVVFAMSSKSRCRPRRVPGVRQGCRTFPNSCRRVAPEAEVRPKLEQHRPKLASCLSNTAKDDRHLERIGRCLSKFAEHRSRLARTCPALGTVRPGLVKFRQSRPKQADSGKRCRHVSADSGRVWAGNGRASSLSEGGRTGARHAPRKATPCEPGELRDCPKSCRAVARALSNSCSETRESTHIRPKLADPGQISMLVRVDQNRGKIDHIVAVVG